MAARLVAFGYHFNENGRLVRRCDYIIVEIETTDESGAVSVGLLKTYA